MTFAAVLLHDRPHLALACLQSLVYNPGAPLRLAIHMDGTDEETRDVARLYAEDYAEVYHESPEVVGPAIGANRLLAHREPTEDFLRVDSDVIFETEGWLHKFLESPYDAVAPSWGMRPKPSTRTPGERYFPAGVLATGVTLYRSRVLDALGAFRSYGRYGNWVTDYHERMSAAGFSSAYDCEVVVTHPGTDGTERWKQEEQARGRTERQRNEEAYRSGQRLYEPLVRVGD